MTHYLRLLVAPLILLIVAACGADSPTSPSFGQPDLQLAGFELITIEGNPLFFRPYSVCGNVSAETSQEIALQDLTVELHDSSGRSFFTQSLANFARSLGPGQSIGGCWGSILDPETTRTAASGVVRVQYSRAGGRSQVVGMPVPVRVLPDPPGT